MRKATIIAIAGILGFLVGGEPAEACCGALYPPVIENVTCSPDTLWPPNHKYRDILVTADVSKDPRDPYNYGVDWIVASITSSQPDDAPDSGDGNTTNDAYVEVAFSTDEDGNEFGLVKARAERCGDTAQYGIGRTYTVVVRAFARGQYQTLISEASCQVYVPHDQRG